MAATVPSWDLFVTLFFIIGVAYGFILQREKVLVTLFSTYAAIVITQMFGTTVQQFFQGDKTILGQVFIRSSASPFTISVGLFAIIIALLTGKSNLGNSSRSDVSPLEVIVYSFLNAGLVLSSLLSFMPEADRLALATQSKMLNRVLQFQQWWIILPVVLVIVLGFRRRRAYE